MPGSSEPGIFYGFFICAASFGIFGDGAARLKPLKSGKRSCDNLSCCERTQVVLAS
jgi:hypothetical protein